MQFKKTHWLIRSPSHSALVRIYLRAQIAPRAKVLIGLHWKRYRLIHDVEN